MLEVTTTASEAMKPVEDTDVEKMLDKLIVPPPRVLERVVTGRPPSIATLVARANKIKSLDELPAFQQDLHGMGFDCNLIICYGGEVRTVQGASKRLNPGFHERSRVNVYDPKINREEEAKKVIPGVRSYEEQGIVYQEGEPWYVLMNDVFRLPERTRIETWSAFGVEAIHVFLEVRVHHVQP